MEAPAGERYSVIVEGLTKRFGDHVAVDNISLRVSEGEFFGFLGPNGAGKSTTIKMLTGMLRPTAGSVKIAGFDLERDLLNVKRAIGVLPEDPSLYQRLNAREMLNFAGQMYGLERKVVRVRSDELIDLMELRDESEKLIIDYSMGMKKKVALAVALIHNPRVLFLDEPFNGIDAISSRAIRHVLRRMTDRGATIFFSSHVMEVVEKLCSRVAIIHQGKVITEGAMSELRESVGGSDGASLEDIFVTLVHGDSDREDLSWLT